MSEQPWEYPWFLRTLPKPGTRDYTMLVVGKEPMTAATLHHTLTVAHRTATQMLSKACQRGWIVRTSHGVYQTRDTVLAHLKIV